MVRYNIRTFAFAILGLGILTYMVILLLSQDLNRLDVGKAIKHLSTTITVNLVIWSIFIKWAWKWRVFYPWLVPFPDLSGKWAGVLNSNWSNKSLPPIIAEMEITQNFFNVQVKIKTDESKSYSISTSFNIDKERGYEQFLYTYLNTPKAGVRERSEIHHGTVLLNFEGFKVKEMDGQYWTDRESIGEISLKRK